VTRLAAALALGMAAASEAEAARIDVLEVAHRKGVYTVRAAARLDAAPAAVFAALVDYDHLARLSPSILESRRVGTRPDGALVFVRSRACAAWFCRELILTQLVTAGGGRIVALALPETSNVSHGRTEWTVGTDGAGTRLAWAAELAPTFYVPPLLGPWLVKAALKREAQRLATGIERTAREAPSP
jgi:hypothetical protein